jgi:osmotically-inducible protein OsmY
MTETRVPVEELGVDSDEGMVTLFGRVPDAEAADSAAAIASRVPGVKGVYTRVTVGPLEEQTKREEMTDEQIAAAIRQRLDDAGLLGADIDVAVESSEARLTGTIGSPEDLYDAVLITRATDGVLAVHEELEVQGKTNGNGNGKK